MRSRYFAESRKRQKNKQNELKLLCNVVIQCGFGGNASFVEVLYIEAVDWDRDPYRTKWSTFSLKFIFIVGLMERIKDGETVILAEGYIFEFERRGYLKAGHFVPEVVLEHPDLVKESYREFVHAGSDVVLAFTVSRF